MKNFAKKVEKASQYIMPAINQDSLYSVSVVPGTSADTAKQGNSKLWANDIGLCRFAPSTQGNWSTARDDLAHLIQQATNGAVTSVSQADDYNNEVFLEQLYHTIMVRNNSNVGAICKAYYVQPRFDKGIVTADSDVLALPRILSDMDESYATAPSPLLVQDEKMGITGTLYDYTNVCRNWNVKLFKQGTIYPGQTVMFKLGTPAAGKWLSVPEMVQTATSSQYHRALVLQFSGLLGHDADDPEFTAGAVAFSKYKMDIIVHKHMKYRQMSASRALQEDHRAANTYEMDGFNGNLEILPAVNPNLVDQTS